MVDNLNVYRTARYPSEADAISLVDSDRAKFAYDAAIGAQSAEAASQRWHRRPAERKDDTRCVSPFDPIELVEIGVWYMLH
jgi:hypothetical protein